MRRLDAVVDRINRLHGSETIVIGSQQYTQKNGKGKADVFANAIKHDHRSPNPTTRWSDVIKLTWQKRYSATVLQLEIKIAKSQK